MTSVESSPTINTGIRRSPTKTLINLSKPWYNSAKSARYSIFLKNQNIKKSKMLILGTPGRSGTHYMMFFFANYLKLLSGTSDGPVDAKTMHDMIPNSWADAYLGQRNFKKPTNLLNLLGLDDFAATHEKFRSPYWNKSKVLHIYRNPLDFCVSTYFFRYEYRTSQAGIVADPVEVMENHLEAYATNYLSYRKVAANGNSHLLRVSYEDLITYPAPTFRMILRWLGVEANTELVELATQYSSRDSIRKIEDRDGVIDPVIDTPDGRFIRDGSIGQWKKYFQPKDVDLARLKLARFGVNLSEFTLDT